jgi:hypothetical protein
LLRVRWRAGRVGQDGVLDIQKKRVVYERFRSCRTVASPANFRHGERAESCKFAARRGAPEPSPRRTAVRSAWSVSPAPFGACCPFASPIAVTEDKARAPRARSSASALPIGAKRRPLAAVRRSVVPAMGDANGRFRARKVRLGPGTIPESVHRARRASEARLRASEARLAWRRAKTSLF